MADVSHLKEGDRAVRWLGGKEGTRMEGVVKAIQGDILIFACKGTDHWPLNELWKFDRKTGAEEDEDLRWGVKYNRTGSFLEDLGEADE